MTPTTEDELTALVRCEYEKRRCEAYGIIETHKAALDAVCRVLRNDVELAGSSDALLLATAKLTLFNAMYR